MVKRSFVLAALCFFFVVKASSAARNAPAAGTLTFVDTAFVQTLSDTTRHAYAYNAAGLITSEVIAAWTKGAWRNASRIVNTYDAAGNALSNLTEAWADSVWAGVNRFTWTYDGNNRMLTSLMELYGAGQWTNWKYVVFTYDGQGNEISDLSQRWQGGQWVNSGRITQTFDPSHNMLTQLMELWQTNQWVNSARYTKTYDVNGNTLTSLSQGWTPGGWINGTNDTYSYDGGNRPVQVVHQQWDAATFLWQNTSRNTNMYDLSGSKLTELVEQWDLSQQLWVNSRKGTFTYDAAGHVLTDIEATWSVVNPQWTTFSRATWTYNSAGSILSRLYEAWITDHWQNGTRTLYAYDPAQNLVTASFSEWRNNAWTPNNASFTITMLPYKGSGSGIAFLCHTLSAVYKTLNATGLSSTYARTAVNKAINPNQTAADTVAVTSGAFKIGTGADALQSGYISDVKVRIDTVIYPSVGDLEFTLMHNGISDTIAYRVGGTGANLVSVLFDDAAPIPLANGKPPFTGSFKPTRPLAQFRNADPHGNWILRLANPAGASKGTLKAWSLILSVSPKVTSVENGSLGAPTQYRLAQNYPNPFNPSTTIEYELPDPRFVRLTVYDMLGRETAVLVNTMQPAGSYAAHFDAAGLPSGVYVYRIQAGNFVAAKKFLLIK